MNNNEYITQLCNEYYNRIYLFLRGYCYDSEIAEDILQETFIEAYRKSEELQNHPNPKGWLYVTARNKAKKGNQKTKQKLLRQLCLDEFDYENLSAEREIIDSLWNIAVWDIQNLITAEEFDMLLLLYVREYTCAEIAQKYQYPENTVKTKISRAKKKIMKKYDLK